MAQTTTRTPSTTVSEDHPFHARGAPPTGPCRTTLPSWGGVRFYDSHLIDAYSNAVALEVLPTKQAEAICQALLAQWQRLGIPLFLQVDNELSFRGSNRYPRSFGLVVRLCLYAGVEIIFIPEGEPWRNGIVERFNDTHDKSFFRRQRFTSLEHLGTETYVFEQFHNEHHRYVKLGGRPPKAVHKRSMQTKRLFRLDLATLRRSWRDGRISFLRLTDRHGSVRFFTERWTLPHFVDREKSQYLWEGKENWHGRGEEAKDVRQAVQA